MTNENIICKGINFGTENPCTGKLQIINNFDELRFVKKNHIILLNINLKFDCLNIVTNLTNKGAISFIIFKISKTDHGCIAAKELGLNFYQINKNKKIFSYENRLITLKENNIYSGKVKIYKKKIKLNQFKLKHEVKINIGFPSNQNYKKLFTKCDGVGFSRIEFLISKILNNIHPHKYIEFIGNNNFSNEIADQIRPAVKNLKKQKKEFWIRTDDFAVEQLLKMEFGKNYEKDEKISSTGYRGIRRSIVEKNILIPVLMAIKKLVSEGYKNIGLFPPMVNSISEYKKWLEIIKRYKLQDIKKGLMIETPRSAIMVDEFLEYIDFIIFGTNDLTSFLLAVDRNNLNLRHMFDEKDKVIQKIISDVIKKSKQKKIKTYLGGSLAENKNILVKFFNDGLTGVTINPDISTINKVKKTIFEIEKKL